MTATEVIPATPASSEPAEGTIDWVVGRMTEIRDRAAAWAERCAQTEVGKDLSPEAIESIRLRHLNELFDDFQGELRCWTAPAAVVMTYLQSRHDLPAITWSRLSGRISGYLRASGLDATELAAAECWVDALNMVEQPTFSGTGMRVWATEIDGIIVEVWALSASTSIPGVTA